MTYLVLPELLGRTILQGAVRMHEIVISEPGTKLSQYGRSVGCGIEPDVIALEGFDERLGHAVTLGRSVRSSARNQADIGGEGTGITSDVARAIVAEPCA
jgi:hypothetical protein